MNLFSSQASLAASCGFLEEEPCCVALQLAPPSPQPSLSSNRLVKLNVNLMTILCYI